MIGFVLGVSDPIISYKWGFALTSWIITKLFDED